MKFDPEPDENTDALPRRLLACISLWQDLLRRDKSTVATELHNDLAQVILGLRLEIAVFSLQCKDDPELAAKVKRLLTIADRTTGAISNLMTALRVPDFALGLADTLDSLCQDFTLRHKLPCELEIIGECNDLDAVKTAVIHRLVYEALQNCAQHAAAGMTWVKVKKYRSALQVETGDDGCGFDINQPGAGKQLGIVVMRECAFALGARLAIESTPSAGTRVILEIPLPFTEDSGSGS